MADDFNTIIPTGIHGRTGKRFHEPLAAEELSQAFKQNGLNLSPAEREAGKNFTGQSYGLPFGTHPSDLRATGWGIVYAKDTPIEIRKALAPLVEHRKTQTTQRFFQEIELEPGEAPPAFLKRFNVAWGTILPHRLPYHLLLVGSPEQIPFEFQCRLDLEYSVGRIHFDGSGPEAYAAYARSVVDYETKVTKARSRQVGFFAPTHSGDTSTQASVRHFVQPLADGSHSEQGPIIQRCSATSLVVTGEEATRDRLRQMLAGGSSQPAILWTAGHGMAFDATDPEQRALQGALLTSDWPGFDQVNRNHYLAGEDIGEGDDVRGLVAFLFACYGAGTPQIDSYPTRSGTRREIAKKPFVAALPQRLLAHGALGVIGHVDVAYGYSFRPRGSVGPQLGPYDGCLGHLLTGSCLGIATCDLSGRAATLGAQMLDALMPGNTPPSPTEVADMWCERNDARGYILLGDPGIKLRFD